MTPPAGQRWTREKPTEEGWYWIRYGGQHWMAFVYWEIDSWWVRRGTSRHAAPIESFVGEWQGPLTPNEATE